MGSPFVIRTSEGLYWSSFGMWSDNLDMAEEYETREKAEKQSRRLGMPNRHVVTRAYAKRMTTPNKSNGA